MILVIDTETSGKADFKASCSRPHQPRMLSFCGLLYDEQGNLVNHVSALVRHRERVEIEPEAAAVNGITSEALERHGIDISALIPMINTMIRRASVVVAFNIQFDSLIVDREFYLVGRLPPFQTCRQDGMNRDGFEEFCCMQAMTDVCRIPSPYRRKKFKWPKLQEAYKHLFGEEFSAAHGARVDAEACARIYFRLRQEAVDRQVVEQNSKSNGVAAATPYQGI